MPMATSNKVLPIAEYIDKCKEVADAIKTVLREKKSDAFFG